MDKKVFVTIIALCLVAIIAGVVVSTNADLKVAHNTSNSVIYGGIAGIVGIFILVKLELLKLD